MVERFSTSLEAELLGELERYAERHGYENRSEAVRDLIRKALVADAWESGRGEALGVISLVYDHHRPNLLNRMTGIQHDASAVVVATTHVHIDHHHCLEVIIARGRPGRLQELADRLCSLRGVETGSLSPAGAIGALSGEGPSLSTGPRRPSQSLKRASRSPKRASRFPKRASRETKRTSGSKRRAAGA